jgi:urea carboxylase
MESPGGYQLVGRTVQIWRTHQQYPPFEQGTPWLLRFFDRINWFPVTAEELLDARADFAVGRYDVRVDDGVFRLGEYEQMLVNEADAIATFRAHQSASFNAERAAWEAAGEFEPREDPVPVPAGVFEVPENGTLVEAPMTSSVWKVVAQPGDTVVTGQVLIILEAMKTETSVLSPCDGVVINIVVSPGTQVHTGSPLAVVEAS